MENPVPVFLTILLDSMWKLSHHKCPSMVSPVFFIFLIALCRPFLLPKLMVGAGSRIYTMNTMPTWGKLHWGHKPKCQGRTWSPGTWCLFQIYYPCMEGKPDEPKFQQNKRKPTIKENYEKGSVAVHTQKAERSKAVIFYDLVSKVN